MKEYKCPRCDSENVMVGAFVLRCLDCDWSYLNEFPCYVCGKPSFSSVGINNTTIQGCREHPASLEACREKMKESAK